nr:MAG TPA: hypothetical protein [Caudoviricetes sp.]
MKQIYSPTYKVNTHKKAPPKQSIAKVAPD